MKGLVLSGLGAVVVAATTLFAAQDAPQAPDFPEMPPPQQEHHWLQQFVGEWTTHAEMLAGPDQPTFQCAGTETVRSFGGRWIISESHTENSPMGPMSAVFTLGFDSEKGKYVGTWIDSIMSHMWVYEGTLDASRNILTLNTTGPNMMEPGKTAAYRDVIEIKSPDHRVLTSWAQDDNGAWVQFGTINYHRRK